MIKEAILLSGGLGTRLRSVVADRPKTLALVRGQPFLRYVLDHLSAAGISRVVLSVGYKKEAIIDYFGDRYKTLKLVYAEEESPLGTGGAIRYALQRCHSKTVIVMNGDSLFCVPLLRLMEFHLTYHSQVTIAVRHVNDISRYGEVRIGSDHRVVAFDEKNGAIIPGWINGGVYCVEREFMQAVLIDYRSPFSIERDVFPKLLFQNENCLAFQSDAYFIDIGTPESLAEAEHTLQAGVYGR